MTERAEMTVSEKRAAHSWVIASNETHSLWERWDGCHAVAGNTGDDAGFTHLRRGWAFYAKGTFTLHRVAGFEWATTDDSWIDEPEEPLPTGHPTPGSTGLRLNEAQREALGPKVDPYRAHTDGGTDAEMLEHERLDRLNTDALPANVELRRRRGEEGGFGWLRASSVESRAEEDEMKVSREELLELLEDSEEIDRGRWRHGHSVRYLIHKDDKHYAIWVQYHPDEGMQVFGDVTLAEVAPVEKIVISWEQVKL